MNVIRSFIAKYFVDTNILDIANLPLTNDLSEILVSMFSNWIILSLYISSAPKVLAFISKLNGSRVALTSFNLSSKFGLMLLTWDVIYLLNLSVLIPIVLK